MRLRLLPLITVVLLSSNSYAQESGSSSKDTLWLVPHTHWEGAVFKTREEYLEISLPHIVRALTLLKAHPEYRFVLDQVCYVKPFLERYPEEEGAFRKFVSEGRLQLVGGIDTMHDNNMPGGESIVHQLLYGKGYYRKKLGVDVKVGWALDTFGHNYSASHQDVQSIENELYRATFNLWTGEMKSLIVKDGSWEVLSGSGNVVAAEHDGGDFWELYGLLNGGRALAMSAKHGVPTRAQLSSQWVGGNGSVRNGPVFSEYTVTHPLGNNNFETTVRLYSGLRRIDINTQILNNDRFLRYRVLFPTSIQNGKAFHEIPFGAIERKVGIEYPAQNWVDYGDGRRGLTLLNRGLPANNVAN